MCLILLSLRDRPDLPLAVAANRDEFYDRPTAPAGFWRDERGILAGRDLQCGGTWLGVTRRGRLAALVNYREPPASRPERRSRGMLVTDFLRSERTGEEFLEQLRIEAHAFSGFSMIFGSVESLYFFSNRGEAEPLLGPGIHGQSNHLPNMSWPKVDRGKDAMKEALNSRDENPQDRLFEILGDRTVPEDRRLPDTGVGLELERTLAPIFVTGNGYGTRSSTVILIDSSSNLTFIERTYNGSPGRYTPVEYRFRIER
jgi:uncharacterized protein with NRDE domain